MSAWAWAWPPRWVFDWASSTSTSTFNHPLLVLIPGMYVTDAPLTCIEDDSSVKQMGSTVRKGGLISLYNPLHLQATRIRSPPLLLSSWEIIWTWLISQLLSQSVLLFSKRTWIIHLARYLSGWSYQFCESLFTIVVYDAEAAQTARDHKSAGVHVLSALHRR